MARGRDGIFSGTIFGDDDTAEAEDAGDAYFEGPPVGPAGPMASPGERPLKAPVGGGMTKCLMCGGWFHEGNHVCAGAPAPWTSDRPMVVMYGAAPAWDPAEAPMAPMPPPTVTWTPPQNLADYYVRLRLGLPVSTTDLLDRERAAVAEQFAAECLGYVAHQWWLE